MIQSAGLEAIEDDLHKVEQALLEVSPPDYPELGWIMDDLFRAGGKRIRPALVLLSARFNSYDFDALVNGAVAAELLHTASLVHDDTIDRADMRRGHATVNSLLPERGAILVGDYIFAQSAIYAAKPGNTEVAGVFARTLSEICDGELRQMLGNHRVTFHREEYYRRIYSKTGALFACSTEIGALLSYAPELHRQALRRYGEKLGQAFQVVDDILDFASATGQTGKPVGSDLRQGTATLPTIIYLEQLSGSNGQAEVVLNALRGGDAAACQGAVELIRESAALDLAYAEAHQLADEATAALLELPSGEARNSLCDLAAYVISRDR